MVAVWIDNNIRTQGESAMIGAAIGLLYANAGEWFIHKHLLHGLGKKKKSFWAFHWHEHHGSSRRSGENRDPHYEKAPFAKTSDGKLSSQGKEALLLMGAAAAHLPLLPIAPFFTGAVWYSIVRYYRVHKRSHLDPEWAREHLPWHYDHHMGPNQHANWCVSRPWFDVILGTREPYVGTERERRDLARRHARAAAKAARLASLQEDGTEELLAAE